MQLKWRTLKQRMNEFDVIDCVLDTPFIGNIVMLTVVIAGVACHALFSRPLDYDDLEPWFRNR